MWPLIDEKEESASEHGREPVPIAAGTRTRAPSGQSQAMTGPLPPEEDAPPEQREYVEEKQRHEQASARRARDPDEGDD
jgi:hypothetical protein